MNLHQSVTFYQEIVGFQVLKQTKQQAILTADGITPLLILEQPADVIPKEARTTGLYHFALLLPTRADLANFLYHILQKGYRLGASDHGVSEAIYIDDPDGNGIEIYRDRPASEWEWSNQEVKMVTDPLDGDGLLAEKELDWNGLPTDTMMGHIHLHVADLQKTKEFYVKGLGFEVVTTYPGALFISTAKYHHHLGLNIWNGTGAPVPKENSVGLNWFTIVLENERKKEQVIQQLRQIGAKVTKDTRDVYKTYDPSGNEIHLVI